MSSQDRPSPPMAGAGAGPAPKARSCVVCKNRKVRCDRRNPCSNCRRANVACIFPTTDNTPRWARRAEHMVRDARHSAVNAAASPQGVQKNTAEVKRLMTKLSALEGVVKDIKGQLQDTRVTPEAGAAALAAASPGSSIRDGAAGYQADRSPAASTDSQPQHLGRIVQQDTSHSRYVSSRFWSRVVDELSELNIDANSLLMGDSEESDDELSSQQTPSTHEQERTPSDRHAFLFRHSLETTSASAHDLHPLPSQIPFIVDVFTENVNLIIQVVHVPTITKIVRDLRYKGIKALSPANEALLFAIYYAAVTSMEEEDVMTNFQATKADLNLKYRLGLENSLARADFLSEPSITLVQALAIFLLLARRYDNPRFIWMMTGLLIRMAQSLGLHRDGSHFTHLSPYEIEIRRRVWWAICLIDVRASEDQGTEFSIANGAFDTRMPLNINDADMEPDSKTPITERTGLTDISISLLTCATCDVSREVMALATSEGMPHLDEQERLINDLYGRMERAYFQYASETSSIMSWVVLSVAKIVMAKLRLFIYLPVLFSPSSDGFSESIRDRLFLAAIEVAEYNHALNAEPGCRHLRWIYQTYTHWHAIVFLLIEVAQRPWSPLVERAWTALHSVWLIPPQSKINKSLRLWLPLRKLMGAARKHREMEVARLRREPQDIESEEIDFQKMALLGSAGTFSSAAVDIIPVLRERWDQLLGRAHPNSGEAAAASASVPQPSAMYMENASSSYPTINKPFTSNSNLYAGTSHPKVSHSHYAPGSSSHISDWQNTGEIAERPAWGGDWSGEQQISGSEFFPQLWTDTESLDHLLEDRDTGGFDIDVADLDGNVDWQNWFQMVQQVELDTYQNSSSGG